MNILQSNFGHEGMNELHVPFPLLYFIHYKEKPQLDFLHPYINRYGANYVKPSYVRALYVRQLMYILIMYNTKNVPAKHVQAN